MTTPADLITALTTIDGLAIGEAESLRSFPVLAIVASTNHLADDATSRVPVLETTYTIESCAVAADGDAATRNARRAEVLAAINTRGEQVRLARGASLNADVVTLPAFGATGSDTLRGYPRVSGAINDRINGQEVAGPWMGLSLTVVQRTALPMDAASGFNLVEHVHQATVSEDTTGGVGTQVRGTVRVKPGQDAADYVDTLILGPAKTQAQTEGRSFTSSVSVGLDGAEASYTYSLGRLNSAISANVSEAQVSESVSRGARYSRTRRINGFAVGPGAATFAAAQAPSVGSNEILVRDEVSEPSVPKGRVNFSYEVSLGQQVGGLPSTVRVHRFEEAIGVRPGGAPIVAVPFFGTGALLYRSQQQAFGYVERSTIEFTPLDAARPMLSPLMDAANLVLEVAVEDRTTDQGSRVVTLVREYVYATSQTLPAPRVLTPTGGA